MSVNRENSLSVEENATKRRHKNGLMRTIRRYVSVLEWLPRYSRLDGVSDLVAGFTLGLTMIPQSIAYAALAGLTAQYGLYSCFMGGFIYLIFGTTKEVSIGPSSLMALLTLEYTRNMPVDFVVLFCFLGGCIELIMGMLHLGFVVDFISMPVTSGFTSATSVIIIVSQLQGLLGLKFKAHNVLDNMLKIFQNIRNIRLTDFSLGLCSIAFLLIFRKLKDIDCSCARSTNRSNDAENGKLKKFLWFLSISRNALVILTASLISFHLESTMGSAPFILSGKVESGLPRVSMPPFSVQVGNETYTFFDMCSHYKAGLIVMPLVSVLANVAIAKAFASGCCVNATQEMLTLGLCNILGSFFSSMPTAGAFTRSAVSSASGVRTPMVGLYTGIMTLLALSFLTPYFYYIPRATLAAVLISAVVFIIDLKIIKLLWKGCKRDSIATIVTFLISIIFGVEIGLLTGALINLIFFLRPSVRPRIEVIQCKTRSGRKYILLKPDSGLTYPTIDYFCSKIVETDEIHGETGTPIVISCERIPDIDYTAIKGIERLSRDLNKNASRLWLLNANSKIVEIIGIIADNKHFRFIDDEDKISRIFYDDTNNDATENVESKLLKKDIVNDNNGLSSIDDFEKECPGKPEVPGVTIENGIEEIALTVTPTPKAT